MNVPLMPEAGRPAGRPWQFSDPPESMVPLIGIGLGSLPIVSVPETAPSSAMVKVIVPASPVIGSVVVPSQTPANGLRVDSVVPAPPPPHPDKSATPRATTSGSRSFTRMRPL